MAKPRGRPFQPGNTLGKGRPKGSRNKTTRAAQQLLERYAEPLIRKCLAQAFNNDRHALRLCVERLIPVRREAPVRIQLPSVATAQDVDRAVQAVLEDIGCGRITVSEGGGIANIVETLRKSIETRELVARVEQLQSAAEKLAGDGRT